MRLVDKLLGEDHIFGREMKIAWCYAGFGEGRQEMRKVNGSEFRRVCTVVLQGSGGENTCLEGSTVYDQIYVWNLGED